MTAYLLDENVLQQMGPGGNPSVRAWLATVDDSDLRISAFTIFEKRRGRVMERNRLADKGNSTAEVEAKIAALDAFVADFGGRVIDIDPATVAEWTELLGAKGNNAIDAAIAAVARVHDLVVVSRNEKDFAGRGVKLLNPFKWPCEIRTV